MKTGLPLCKLRRKPGFVPGFHRVCPRDKPGVVPGTNPVKTQDQPDKKVYVYVPFSCLSNEPPEFSDAISMMSRLHCLIRNDFPQSSRSSTSRYINRLRTSCRNYISQGSVNGGFQTLVQVLSGEQSALPPFNLNLTSS